jgi:hypothetical protein
VAAFPDLDQLRGAGTADSAVDDELWEAFHADRLHAQRGDEPESTAGDAGWRHSLMIIGHDPLKEP